MPDLWKMSASQVVGLLKRRGKPAIFLARFTAFVRSVMPAAAGAAKIPYPTFLLWSVPAAVTTMATKAAINAERGIARMSDFSSDSCRDRRVRDWWVRPEGGPAGLSLFTHGFLPLLDHGLLRPFGGCIRRRPPGE